MTAPESIALEAFTTPDDTLQRLLDRLLPELTPGATVLVKPEWCSRRDPQPSENTSPAFLAALFRWLDARGCRVTLAHSSLLTPPDVPYTSFTDLLKLAQVDHLLEDFPHLGLMDLETEPMELRRSIGPDGVTVELLAPRVLSQVDHVIVCARPKTHMGTQVALGTKGLMGLLPDSENLRMHRDGLDALLAHLGHACQPSLTLIEADLGMQGNGPHHGEELRCGYYLGGHDLLQVDNVAAQLMGFAPDEVHHLRRLAALKGRPSPLLPAAWSTHAIDFARPQAYLQHSRKVRVWPGDSCATCHVAAGSVQDFVRDNPHRLSDVATVASMLFLKGMNIYMGHHDPSEPPPEGELSVAIGDCTQDWARAHDVPRVPGCPVRYHQVQPTLMQMIRQMVGGQGNP